MSLSPTRVDDNGSLVHDHQAMLIDLALAVLDEQHGKAKAEKRQVPEVRLALHVLRPHVPKEWLVWFWEACGHDDPLYRQADITRTLNGIRLRVVHG